ncbi:hypothetical protein PH7735_02605 [Shimia thalassica]|uniref:Chitin-binding type-2 domain-containing protein n=1 Tax=Shimia thalassica TaxID=1715693 RepID=A0A0P1IAY1_9RHOB|nr:hypothetical protein [Shimia thalassica]CUK02537.1 hypothetical protein PH7735_02605 [Shimia thalassica]
MSRIILALALTATPMLVQAKPITSLTIHSEENRLHCNDGFWWSAKEAMCMPDNGR